MKFDLIKTLMTMITAILMAAIPWAYTVGGRISSIEAQVKLIQVVEERDFKQVLKGIDDLHRRIESHEIHR